MPNIFDQFDQPNQPTTAPIPQAEPSAPSDRTRMFSAPVAPQAPAPGQRQNVFDQFDSANSQESRESVSAPAPDDRSMWQRAYDAVAGRQDPRYADLKSFNEEMSAEGNRPVAGKLGVAAITGAGDEAFGDVMRKSLGDRFIRNETDANGYPIIVFRDQAGQEKKAYVNKPGLDVEDVARAGLGAIPYLPVARGIALGTQGARLGTRAAVQALGGAGTSIAGDVAARGVGSDQPTDLPKAGIIGALGAAGELFGAAGAELYRRLVTVPGLYDAATGRLTAKGLAAAQASGVDPAMAGKIAQTFADVYSKSENAAKAGANFAAGKMGIQSTVGQRTKDAEKLLQEEAMRRGLYGESAKSVMQQFDEAQRAQIRAAATGKYDIDPRTGAATLKPGIASSLAPSRMLENFNPADLGQGIRQGMQTARGVAKGQEKQAWNAVSDLLPTPQSFQLLPQSLAGRLGANRVTNLDTTAANMARAIDGYMTGRAFNDPVASVLQQTPVRTIDEMRRHLLSMYQNAAPGTNDARLSRAIYDGFNDWVGLAADRQLLSGAPEAAANMRIARSVTRGNKDLFQPSQFGRQTPGARILSDVMDKSDSAEGIVSGLFGAGPKANIQKGSIEALQKMQAALQQFRDPFNPNAGRNAWNDIRAAYWMRLVQGKDGELYNPKVMLNNIRTAFANQRSVVQQLYGRQEQAQMQEFMRALQQITYKDPNPSGSSYGIAAFAKQFLGTLFEAAGSLIPLPGVVKSGIGAVVGNPVRNAYGATAARAATTQAGAKATPPSAGGLFTGIGQEYERQRNQ